MRFATGIDIIYLPRFRKALQRGGEAFLRRVYQSEELKDQRAEHLAGIFAAKEATIKALGLPMDAWNEIGITHQHNGAPIVQIENCKLKIENCSLSISHDGNYVIACFVALIK